VSHWARPARPAAPIAVAVLIVGLWWLVAHNGGAGWVQFLGDLVFGTLAIGIVGPSVVVARARVSIRSAPADGIASMPVEVYVESRTRLRVRPAAPPGPEVFVGPVRRKGDVDDRVTLVPVRRGVHDRLTLDIASAWPFALQWWTRRVQLPLPCVLHVSPRCGAPAPPRLSPHEGAGEVTDRPLSDAGLPRGARPYVPGDSRRLVHWRATAHAGRLMVRELERPAAEPITVTVDLPADPDEAERVAERALGTVVDLLERGVPVLLATLEPAGPVRGPVENRRGAGRRLARAVERSDRSAAAGGVVVTS
jgi:uncharacterized protein (DUF58 family)